MLYFLIERFYELVKGDIYYNGINMRDYDLAAWRRRIAYVDQNSPIISGSIKDNILYGTESYNQNELLHAIKCAGLEDLISNANAGLHTEVGELGVKLSGGQRQRIAIARAFMKDPEILLLDEATAHLDGKTETAVQKALEVLMKDRITLVIAHRYNTIEQSESIVVLDKGKVAAIGTHEILLKSSELYRELVQSKFSDCEMVS